MAASAIVSHINLNPTFSTTLSSSSSLSPYPALRFPKFKSSPLSLAVKPKPLTRHIQGLSPLSSSPLIARAIPSSSVAPDSTTRQIFHALFVFESSTLRHTLMRIARASSSSSPTPSPFAAASCYVVGDNIDTDQKNPVDCLTDELEGSDALSGLPPDKKKSKFPIEIGGTYFGCRLPPELAPAVLVVLLALLMVGHRKATVTNIINDHSQSLPKITTIENHNRFGVSVNNGKGNVGR